MSQPSNFTFGQRREPEPSSLKPQMPETEHPDSDAHKGAVEEETSTPSSNGEPNLYGQLGHRDQDEMLKDADTDFPEPDPVRSTAARAARALHKLSGKGAFLLGACFVGVLLGAAALTRRHIHLPPFSGTASGRHPRRQFGRRFRHGQSGRQQAHPQWVVPRIACSSHGRASFYGVRSPVCADPWSPI